MPEQHTDTLRETTLLMRGCGIIYRKIMFNNDPTDIAKHTMIVWRIKPLCHIIRTTKPITKNGEPIKTSISKKGFKSKHLRITPRKSK